MTRKEAFEKRPMLYNLSDGLKVDEFIRKIYDDFEKKNTIDVKLTELEPFKDFINLLKENINSLPTELKDKLSEILEK